MPEKFCIPAEQRTLEMAILAAAAFVFGVLASFVFAGVPFVAGNVLLAFAIVALGLLSGFSFVDTLLRVVVASASLQAGFLLGLMRNLRSRARVRSNEARRNADVRVDKSTMDSPR